MNTEAILESADAEAMQPPPTLLFVDDEPNILTSLRRLFRPQGYRILTAESGEEGLKLLASEQVAMVISDMRMPQMNGAEFLEQVRRRWPETVRILLTGYADIGATVDAINKGEIYRYIAKPWEENDLVLGVRHALERQHLESEKHRLELLTRRQNAQLRELNASLEEKVVARTEELERTMDELARAHEKLKKGFVTSIRVFSSLMEMREPALAGHSRRVAELARTVAQKLGMPDNEVQDVFLAGLLHDIGKLGFNDKLLSRPWSVLSTDERTEFSKHATKGEASLMALDQLRDAARLIRHHHERFDGLGYPDRLSGLAIPLGARILAPVNDFDRLQIGTLTEKRMSEADALAMVIEGKGSRYDPSVVDVLVQLIARPANTGTAHRELALPSSQLGPGMVLARDLITRDGVLLLSRDYVLDERLIDNIRAFERADGHPLSIFVLPGRRL